MSLGKMKLATKLALGFGLVLALLCLVAYTGFSRTTSLREDVTLLTKERLPQVEIIYSIMKHFDQSARAVRNIAFTTSESDNNREKEKYEKGKAGVFDILNKLEKMLVTPRGKELFAPMKANAVATFELMDKGIVLGMANKNEELGELILNQVIGVQNKFLEACESFSGYVVDLAEKRGEESIHEANNGVLQITFTAGVALLLGAFLAFFITRSITRPINRVVEGLAEASDQVAAASGQVSSASQQLAEGSSEQAASIEETSSSLEEMSSMTKQNADHANHANQLMKEAQMVISEANRSMTNLTVSMTEISKASEETQKIIKTIDEIAFQTNLLALNAAVEAARAGEAGAGFAVVADEVRNLAMRAAEAAKNTAALIEGTVKTVKGGSEIVQATGKEFEGVASAASKMAELVGEIAAASQEQAQGIDQINKAVSEMDKVVQENTASAEESASASEEMNAQAEQLKVYVEDLMAVIGGSVNHTESRQRSVSKFAAVKAEIRHVPQKALTRNNTNGKGNGKDRALRNAKEIHPSQVIPFGEESLEDF